jgi:hypothetical protein
MVVLADRTWKVAGSSCWESHLQLQQEANISATYNGPVSESMIAARNRDREAGYKIWASTLPAPADCIGVKSAWDA